MIIDWGIPAVIISDRDPNFFPDIWQMFSGRMGTKLFIFTVYHPQTDGISKRTNQTVEITIRFLITNYPDINLVLTFPSFQTQFNKSFNITTGFSVNEFNYGFKIRETFSGFTEPNSFDLPAQCLKYRQEITDVTAFVNVEANIYYDVRHTPLLSNAEDQISLE